MANVVFLNATQHNLTKEQIEAIPKLAERYVTNPQIQILNLKDIEPELFNELKNIKFGELTYQLAVRLNNLIHRILVFGEHTNFKEVHRLFVHLPIGSPKFMFEFAITLYRYADAKIVPVFSHTDRVVEEKVNEFGEIVKVSRFKFNGFEEVDLCTIGTL
jgi:hypothetical protein